MTLFVIVSKKLRNLNLRVSTTAIVNIAVTLLYLQTVLFSATLPKLLVEFASAGLSDPTLVRLDVDAKIPETLKMGFFHCRPEVKDALLIHVLTSVIPQGQQVRHRTTSYVQLTPAFPPPLKLGSGCC